MKATNNRLSYWKARQIDARASLVAAEPLEQDYGPFCKTLAECLVHATEKVNQLEREIGVRNG